MDYRTLPLKDLALSVSVVIDVVRDLCELRRREGSSRATCSTSTRRRPCMACSCLLSGSNLRENRRRGQCHGRSFDDEPDGDFGQCVFDSVPFRAFLLRRLHHCDVQGHAESGERLLQREVAGDVVFG